MFASDGPIRTGCHIVVTAGHSVNNKQTYFHNASSHCFMKVACVDVCVCVCEGEGGGERSLKKKQKEDNKIIQVISCFATVLYLFIPKFYQRYIDECKNLLSVHNII